MLLDATLCYSYTLDVSVLYVPRVVLLLSTGCWLLYTIRPAKTKRD